MNIPMFSTATPCAQWAHLLAAQPGDLSPDQRAALDDHLATCATCATIRAEYRAMDSSIRALPAPQPLPALPPALLRLWEDEDQQRSKLRERATTATAAATVEPPLPVSLHSNGPRPLTRRHRVGAIFGSLVATLLIGALLGGYFLLVAGHRPAAKSTAPYGPVVDPAGPRPHLGAWRTIILPSGVPDRAAQLAMPGALGGQPTGGATIFQQPAVSGLLYLVAPPIETTPLRIWRSQDAGATWQPLPLPSSISALPSGASAYLYMSAGDPDTVFMWAYAVSPQRVELRLYSSDRGAHWSTFALPSGSDTWNVAAPSAAHGVWYLPVSVASQPAIWISTDHGAHWSAHAYPVTLPTHTIGQPATPSGIFLDLTYARGGLLWAYQHTLWWTPDYGAHWQALGAWGEQPCDALIQGTPDLAALYCMFSNGQQSWQSGTSLSSVALWRSTDHGRTWQPIPAGPDVTPSADDTHAYSYVTSKSVLRDGSLLTLASSRENAAQVAFYTLAPGANVWHEASAPLTPSQGYCAAPQGDLSTPGANGSSYPPAPPECAQPLDITVTSAPNGAQYIYLTHEPYNQITTPTYVAAITWK
ncbi:MAG: hypothetical protein OJF49_001404 [Ktedonobacterales bacterium]|jgi:hypothetical protein|nr:MAG: hypothetical protein OJF49_001404 [Ktedonobacterales bacterium]